MKKAILICLLCFAIAFVVFAVPMSPHPGDSLDTVFTIQDNVIISQAVSASVDILYFDQFNIYNANEICVSAEANDKTLNPYHFLDSLSAYDAVAVSYIGYEMENIFYKTGRNVVIYKTEFG